MPVEEELPLPVQRGLGMRRPERYRQGGTHVLSAEQESGLEAHHAEKSCRA